MDLFTPYTGTYHVTALWCGWVFGCLFIVLFLGVFPVFLLSVTAIGLCIGSHQFTLRLLQEWPLRDLIKLLI